MNYDSGWIHMTTRTINQHFADLDHQSGTTHTTIILLLLQQHYYYSICIHRRLSLCTRTVVLKSLTCSRKGCRGHTTRRRAEWCECPPPLFCTHARGIILKSLLYVWMCSRFACLLVVGRMSMNHDM